MKDSGIYKITNLVNGKIYIGSAVSIKKRWSVHIAKLRSGTHHSKHMKSAWLKYGEENFKFEVLEEVEDTSLLLSVEQKYLDSYNPCNPEIGYNSSVTAGSMLGHKRRVESNLKLAKSIAEISEETYISILYDYMRGLSARDIGLKYKVATDNIYRYVHNKTLVFNQAYLDFIKSNPNFRIRSYHEYYVGLPEKIVALHLEGVPRKSIMYALGVSKTYVNKCIRRNAATCLPQESIIT